MNKHIINKAAIFVLIILISFSLSSCKKEETKENKSVVSTLLKNEYSGKNSLIEIPLSEKDEVINNKSLLSESIEEEEIVSNESNSVESSSINESETIPNLDPSGLSEESLVPISFEIVSEPFTKTLSIDNIDLEISIYDSYSTILYPETIKNDFILSFIEYVLSIYPSLIDSVTYTLNNGEAVFNYPDGFIGDDSWKESVVLEFNKLIEDFIKNDKEKDYTTYKYILYGKDLTILISKEDVIIDNISTFNNDEINSIKDIIISNYPELSLLSYSIENDQLILSNTDSFDIYSYITKISSLINDDTNNQEEIIINEVKESMDIKEEAVDAILEVINNEVEEIKPVVDETELKKEEVEEEIESLTTDIDYVEPLTEKGRSVKKYEIAFAYSPDLTLTPAVFENHYVNLRLFYSLSDNFKLGISTSYDLKNNLLLSIVAKYYLNKSIYAYFEGGNTFILNEALKPNYFVQLGLGYSYKVSDSFNLFAELGVKYNFNDYKISPKVSVGGSILF